VVLESRHSLLYGIEIFDTFGIAEIKERPRIYINRGSTCELLIRSIVTRFPVRFHAKQHPSAKKETSAFNEMAKILTISWTMKVIKDSEKTSGNSVFPPMTDDGQDVGHTSIHSMAKQLEGYERYRQFMVRLTESNADDDIDLLTNHN
jgi:hypothetical protein